MDDKKTEETGSSEKNFYEIQNEKTLETVATILEPEAKKEEPVNPEKQKPAETVADYLALSDPRFGTVAIQVIKEAQHKFFKLYKKTPDKDKREFGAELVVWIAHMTLVYLTMLERHDKMGNATEVFLQAFDHMLKIKQSEIEALKRMQAPNTEVAPDGNVAGNSEVVVPPGTEQPAEVRSGDPEQHQA
jgi:hypothetical protein